MFGKEKKIPEEKNTIDSKELDQETLEQVSAGGNPFENIQRIKEHELDEDVYNKA